MDLSLLAQEDGGSGASSVDGLADLINRVMPEQLHFLVEGLVSPGLTILFILVVATIASSLARRAIGRLVQRMKTPSDSAGARLRHRMSGVPRPEEDFRRIQRADALGALGNSIAKVVIWLIAITMMLGQVGVELGPLIAGAGIVGIALGFGAQDLVKDFLSGVFMLIEDQYGVGDIVDAGEAVGVVEGVTLRSTRLRSIDGTLWYVPNGEIRRVGNMSHEFARAMLDISVAYGADIDAAADIIERVAVEMSQEEDYLHIFLEPPEILGVERLGNDAVDIRLLIKTQPAKQWTVSRELRRRIKNAFDAAEVEIPFPQRTVWLRTERAISLGDQEAEPFTMPVPDEAAKVRAVEASHRGGRVPKDEMADMLPDEVEAAQDEGSSER
ncbi:MAG: mechanosensitive ion channel family protein [Nitriliruptoraceae bacterium]